MHFRSEWSVQHITGKGLGCKYAYLHSLAGHDLDGDIVAQGRNLLEENDRPVPRLPCI